MKLSTATGNISAKWLDAYSKAESCIVVVVDAPLTSGFQSFTFVIPKGLISTSQRRFTGGAYLSSNKWFAFLSVTTSGVSNFGVYHDDADVTSTTTQTFYYD